jgi:SagB-type dehydrogenase family enzyme
MSWVRARSLVCYWDQGKFTVRNYLTNGQVEVGIGIVAFLDTLSAPFSWKELLSKVSHIPFGQRALRELREETILLRVGTIEEGKDRELAETWKWGHDARHFHFGTQHVRFNFNLAEVRKVFEKKAVTDPPPSPFLNIDGQRTTLPNFENEFSSIDFWNVLNSRRSCRQFETNYALNLVRLSALLKAAFGFQQYFNNSALDQRVIKTSPSGGARHPLEAYLILRSVSGIKPGIYHYGCARHDLVRIGRRPSRKHIIELFGGQTWMADASALVVFTAVVGRSMWKYEHSRAYRVLTLDAGHLGQTFQLTGTALGLAVFNTAAFDDAALEKLLQVDGVRQIVVYAGALGLPATSLAATRSGLSPPG